MKGSIFFCLAHLCAIAVVLTAEELTTYDDGRPPIHNDPLCSKNGTYFLPNPDDCTLFFECVDGNKYLFVCPPNLHFNPSINECDFPANAGCDGKKAASKTASDEEDGKPPVIDDPDCPEEGVSYLVNKANCSIYYECVDGNKFEFVCPAGLHFNMELETCDFPKHAHCKAEKSSRAARRSTDEDDEEETPAPPTYDPETCEKEGIYFVRNTEDCTIYYECVEQYLYEFKCPAGLYFNMELETCDHPKNVPECN